MSKYKIKFILKEVNLSPSNARVAIIKYIRDQGFKNIIFADCDDIMPSNRVLFSIEKLNNKHDIIVNDLNLFTGKKINLSNRYLSAEFATMIK